MPIPGALVCSAGGVGGVSFVNLAFICGITETQALDRWGGDCALCGAVLFQSLGGRAGGDKGGYGLAVH